MSVIHSSPIPSADSPLVAQAMADTLFAYGDRATLAAKTKSLFKFGRNRDLGTADSGNTIMTLPAGEAHETYVETNIIDTISSSSVSDVGQTIRIEGHEYVGTDKKFRVQNATINGQNKVVLGTPLARMTRMYNASDTELVGDIYGYQDGAITAGVPNVGSTVHCMINSSVSPLVQQSEKAATALDDTTYWFVTYVFASVLEKTASFAEVGLQIREPGGVFRTIVTIGVASGAGLTVRPFAPYLVVPKNSDVRLVGVGSAASLDVSGGIAGYLAGISVYE